MTESFLHPGLLLGLVAALVPILLYLLFRRPAQVVRWAAFDLLQRAIDAAARSARRREHLLLLTRVALVTLLVLACAAPLVPARRWLERIGAQTLPVAIVLDTSATMRAHDGETPSAAGTAAHGGRSRFDRARAEAAKLLERLGHATPVSVITAGASAEIALRDATPDEARRALLGIDAGYAATDRADLARRLAELAPETRVVWFSDAAPAPRGATAVHVADRAPPHHAVVDVRVEPVPGRAWRHRIEARVEHAGPARTIEARLVVDGAPRARAAARLVPGEPASVAFEASLPQDRPAVVAVELAPDATPYDDRGFAVHVPAPSRTVRLVGGRSSPWLDAALDSIAGATAGSTPVRLERTALDALPGIEARSDDILVLAGSRAPERAGVEALERASRSGAALVWFPDPAIDPARAHDLERLFGVELGELRDTTGSRDPGPAVTVPRPDHPIVRSLLSASPHALSGLDVRRFRPARPAGGSRVLVRVGADPAVVSDEGARRLVVALSPDPLDTDLALAPASGHALVPLLLGIVGHLSPAREPVVERVCGEPIGAPGEAAPGRLLDLEGRTVGADEWLDAPPGVYRAGERIFLLHPPVEESVLLASEETAEPEPGLRLSGRWPLLWIAALLLLAESWIAARLSRREGAPA